MVPALLTERHLCAVQGGQPRPPPRRVCRRGAKGGPAAIRGGREPRQGIDQALGNVLLLFLMALVPEC